MQGEDPYEVFMLLQRNTSDSPVYSCIFPASCVTTGHVTSAVTTFADAWVPFNRTILLRAFVFNSLQLAVMGQMKQKMVVYELLAALVMILALTGCESLQTKEHEKVAAEAPAPASVPAREIEALFSQPYIDPLTRYLQQHGDDERRAEYLSQVLQERDRRCDMIAQRYATRPLTRQTLEQYRAGYGYSCPAQVAAFARRLAEVAPTAAEAQNTSAVAQTNAGANGDWSAQLNDCYLLTSIRNHGEARQACLEPAERGDARAQYNMALIARALGDYTDALHWAHMAADRSARARYLLGDLYAKGQGVAADDANALRWYREAAEMGDAAAQYQVGRFLAQGRAGPRDPEAALDWFERAANRGNAPAQLALGQALLEGSEVHQNRLQGRHWLLRAARQGLAEAQWRLGRLAEEGGNSVANQADALVWYELAIGNGLQRAAEDARRLRSLLSIGAVEDARRRIRHLLEGGR